MGGSAQTWSTELTSGIVAGTAIVVELTMTKFGGPAVEIGYALSLQ